MVYTGNWEAIYEQKGDVLDQIMAVQNKKVFDTRGKGPFSWHEQRLGEYDVVALDFCDMVGTSSTTASGESHTRQWLRNVYTEPVGSLPECKVPQELDKPYVPEGASCTLIDEPSSAAAATSVVTVLVATALLVMEW